MKSGKSFLDVVLLVVVSVAVASSVVGLAAANGLPRRMLGMYVLLADDTTAYPSNRSWQPELPATIQAGSNTVFFTFINPTDMRVPPAFANLAHTRGTNKRGAIPASTTILFSIGGEAYSNRPNPWPFLASPGAAQAMAAQVAQWPKLYGCDGIDMDLETGAGDDPTAGSNAIIFFKALRRLNPDIVITQPVFGYPQVDAENYIVNNGWTKSGAWLGGANAVGIMVYTGSQSLQYVKNYADGSGQWQGFPIKVNVPTPSVLVGACGCGSSSDVMTLAHACVSQNLGGIMVWYASALDSATGRPAIQYGGGTDDASVNVGQGWQQALRTML
eukprot:TRINITY_DN3326_c0_g1_i2.p1 TRINITY_DN3326_c0_g1~~TRINITY_DN3326_c0_g1_i2.p1  ORF type:complete len:330 (-),score=42.53 TRINITY_DN3326_c0_g1_i2:125-1114(-)